MNAVDKIIRLLKPFASYEAAQPTRMRKFRKDNQSPNQLVQKGAVAVRNQARYLQRNHDIIRGIIRTMVNNIVGANGIGIEPQPRRMNGEIHEEYATALREAWRDWCIKPEVTQTHTWSSAQRLLASTWLRDGEVFTQQLIGPVASLDHGTIVPYSIELIEPDLLPHEFDDPGKRIRQSIERNNWGRRVAYWVYKDHPSDSSMTPSAANMKRIPADRMLHLALFDRIGQLRGVSELASIITRLEDIKDYEESERVAAKIAARLTAFVKKGSPDMFNPEALQQSGSDYLPREISFEPGMVIDSLGPGEEVGLIDSKRPNVNAVAWRQGQLRAAAAGIGASYSSIAKDYNGTYSAQRQELVEQWVNYAVLCDEFTGKQVAPVWRNFVAAADLSGAVKIPGDVDPNSVDDCLYIAQSMPWIDPVKEALSWKLLVRAGFSSEVEVMRRRGANPRDVLQQIKSFRKKAEDAGLTFDSDAGKASVAGAAQDYLREREGMDTEVTSTDEAP